MALGSFELDIKRFVEKAKGNIDVVVRKVALDLFTRIVIKSPVLTGRFRANWQIAVNTIPAGTFDELDPTGSKTVAKIQAASLGFAGGQVIYAVNNLAYANRLEFGYSKQAPAGMVRITAQEYGAVVTKAASEVPK